jgi:signal transduction histidine kinase
MRAFEGSGLGLTIVKKLTDLMEGRIEVDSKKGKGTTMRVILPKGTDA